MDEYEAQGHKGVTIDAPVLFESGFDKMCDITVAVVAPYEKKLERIISRDKITKENLKKASVQELAETIGVNIDTANELFQLIQEMK